ncbi:NAD(P)-binding domain-containing protein [Zunongwangia sp.]|uniref:NAD(P)-binding domain-containing protein n=1 Tax=Zunongwangia sp. TaxID=1965325 RepID=UPI003AA9CA96
MTSKKINYKVAIIGAGQAGLATSYYLQKSGINHIVLEKNVIGSSWVSQRWDSFKMNTPNWMTALPEMPLTKAISQQFMTKNEFVAYLKAYVQKFKLPIVEEHQVLQLKKQTDSFTILAANKGKRLEIKADFVVIASGIMNKPKFPKLAQKIPDNIVQLHAATYKNPNQLPKGRTLVVGGGQSGCQIAEELALSGKKVYLASSKVPRAPRRYRGRDIMEWLDIMGIQDTLTQDVKSTQQVQTKQPQSSGVGVFGHTISYQSLHQVGVAILGSFKGIDNATFYFSDNAKENIRFADDASQAIKENIDGFLIKHPELNTEVTEKDKADFPDANYSSASEIKEISIKQAEITSIIWATGFGYDFSYLESALLNDTGSPVHNNGIMNTERLYCIGFPWLRKKKSGLVYGIQEDAKFLVKKIKNA